MLIAPIAATPGLAANAFLELLIERHLLAFLVARGRQRDFHRQHLVGAESGIHLLKLPQAADQQAGADEQHDRHRDFGDDQQLARAAADRRALRAAAFLQRVVEVLLRQVEGRHQAEQHARRHRRDQREDEHAAVQSDLIGARDAGRGKRGQRACGPERDQQAAGGAEQAERRALGQHLPHQLLSIRANRRAQGELTQPAGAVRQQEVRDVRARDEQDDDDRRAEQKDDRPRFADHRFEERIHLHALIGVARRELLLEARGNGFDLGARLLHRHAVLQTRDGADEVAAAIRLRGIETKRREDVGGPFGIDLEMTEIAGRMPITVAGIAFSVICCPTIVGSAPKRRRQKPSLNSATRRRRDDRPPARIIAADRRLHLQRPEES